MVCALEKKLKLAPRLYVDRWFGAVFVVVGAPLRNIPKEFTKEAWELNVEGEQATRYGTT